MRLSGIAASIATFAVLAVIIQVYSNWDSVTGAQSSVVGIPIVRIVWPYFLCAVIVVLVAYVHAISRSGLALRAARDEATAAAASGVDIPRERLIAFMISGAIMGLGGALFAHSVGVVTPDTFYLGLTFITLSMLVVGGMNSLSGAVLGVVDTLDHHPAAALAREGRGPRRHHLRPAARRPGNRHRRGDDRDPDVPALRPHRQPGARAGRQASFPRRARPAAPADGKTA